MQKRDFETKNINLILEPHSLVNEKYLKLLVSGNSMSPCLRDQDEVFVQFIEIHALKCGDVIAIADEDIITHRYIASEDHMIITRGDNRYYFDPPRRFEDYLGKIVWVKRGDRIANFSTLQWQIVNTTIGCMAKISFLLSSRFKAQNYRIPTIVHQICFRIWKIAVRITLLMLAWCWVRNRWYSTG
jgi:signal peptidase I